MTQEIGLLLGILAATILLFVTEKLRVDVVALLVLGGLVIAGLVTPEQAISGFSNPAVVTVWAVFILSGGLAQTGIANQIGRQVLRLAGNGEVRLLIVIMLTAGVMSAFMNNIGVAALLLPVVLDISRQTKRPPSRLLLPLVFGALLGGMLTLIGTPPNILVSDALRDAGLEPLTFFDFTPAGLVVLLVGTAFMVLVGRHLLPARDRIRSFAREPSDGTVQEQFHLLDVLAEIEVPANSGLAGKTLAESRIGRALGLNILALMRNGRRQLAPEPEAVLQENDCLLVLGRLERLEQLRKRPNLIVDEENASLSKLISGPLSVAEFRVAADSPYAGKTLLQLDMRHELDVIVLAIRRGERTYLKDLSDIPLQDGDQLLVQTEQANLGALADLPDYHIADVESLEVSGLAERLATVRVPEDSPLQGMSLFESRMGQTFGLTALSLGRDGQADVMPEPDTALATGDTLIVKGDPRDLQIVRHLQNLVVHRKPSIDLDALTMGSLTLVEAMLSPYTTLADKTLNELRFRERFGLNVVAIWRGGRAIRSNLAEVPLRMGDALLLYGSQEKINLLGREPDFLVLRTEVQPDLRLHKAPVAGLLMLGVIVTVLLGLLPIAIAAVIGATLMVITGCLDMEEAYRYIEWKAVFLIAGMLPMGIAMDETGAADYLAQGMVSAIGTLGPQAVLGGLFVLAMLATLFMPNPVVAVLMAPIALSSAADLGVSPYAFMIAISFGASASFLSPVGHPANVLVMGPGGYRFTDYIKVGLPLALVLLVVVVATVPLFWPLMGG